MKKILLVLFFSINLSGFLFGQDKSNLTISTTGSSNLKIIYAGKKYSLQDRSQTFQGQNPGTYSLVIYQWQTKQAGGDYIKVYDGTIRLTGKKHLEFTVLRFGKTAWDESDITGDTWNENYTNPGPVTEPGDNYYNNSQQGVTATQFANVKKVLGNEYNEEERLNLVKVVFKNNLFSSEQIKELAKNFYNEERRLRFTKYAYDFCWDKGNYFTLAEIFYNSGYRKEFIEYIGSR